MPNHKCDTTFLQNYNFIFKETKNGNLSLPQHAIELGQFDTHINQMPTKMTLY